MWIDKRGSARSDCKNSIDNYECENCSKRCIDLLNINDEENRSASDGVIGLRPSEHFVLIEKLHVFMNKQRQRWICRNCLNECFHRKEDLMKHHELCLDQESLKCKFPWKSHLSFDKYYHKIDVPFRIYADFETMNVPANTDETYDSSQTNGHPEYRVRSSEDQRSWRPPADLSSSTIKLFDQISVAVGYRLVCDFSEEYQIRHFGAVISGYYQYFSRPPVVSDKVAGLRPSCLEASSSTWSKGFARSAGSNVIEWFTDEIITIQKMFFKYFSNTNYPIHMSSEDKIEYEIADRCWFCNELFSEKDIKVRDHDHLVEKNNYRGAAHSSCNLRAWSIRSAQTLYYGQAREDDDGNTKYSCR